MLEDLFVLMLYITILTDGTRVLADRMTNSVSLYCAPQSIHSDSMYILLFFCPLAYLKNHKCPNFMRFSVHVTWIDAGLKALYIE